MKNLSDYFIPKYNDENARDAIGNILDDGTLGDIVFTYDGITPKISATIKEVFQTKEVIQTINSTETTTNINLANGHIVLLTMNHTCAITFSNVPTGYSRVIVRFIQDGTGSRLWNNQNIYKWPLGVQLPLSTAINSNDDYQLYTFNGGLSAEWNVAMIGAEVQ